MSRVNINRAKTSLSKVSTFFIFSEMEIFRAFAGFRVKKALSGLKISDRSTKVKSIFSLTFALNNFVFECFFN